MTKWLISDPQNPLKACLPLPELVMYARKGADEPLTHAVGEAFARLHKASDTHDLVTYGEPAAVTALEGSEEHSAAISRLARRALAEADSKPFTLTADMSPNPGSLRMGSPHVSDALLTGTFSSSALETFAADVKAAIASYATRVGKSAAMHL